MQLWLEYPTNNFTKSINTHITHSDTEYLYSSNHVKKVWVAENSRELILGALIVDSLKGKKLNVYKLPVSGDFSWDHLFLRNYFL